MRNILWAILVVMAVVVTGCSTATGTPPSDEAASATGIIADETLGIKNSLLIGIYRLSDSGHPLTGEQAAQLATLWEAYKSVTTSGTSATEETEALITQMQTVLTAEQIAAINAMALDSEDLLAFYAEVGIEMPTPVPGAEAVAPGSGSGQDLTEEEKAERRAANGGETGASKATIVIDKVIAHLQSIN